MPDTVIRVENTAVNQTNISMEVRMAVVEGAS